LSCGIDGIADERDGEEADRELVLEVDASVFWLSEVGSEEVLVVSEEEVDAVVLGLARSEVVVAVVASESSAGAVVSVISGSGLLGVSDVAIPSGPRSNGVPALSFKSEMTPIPSHGIRSKSIWRDLNDCRSSSVR
jgi:hypothetical protein